MYQWETLFQSLNSWLTFFKELSKVRICKYSLNIVNQCESTQLIHLQFSVVCGCCVQDSVVCQWRQSPSDWSLALPLSQWERSTGGGLWSRDHSQPIKAQSGGLVTRTAAPHSGSRQQNLRPPDQELLGLKINIYFTTNNIILLRYIVYHVFYIKGLREWI